MAAMGVELEPRPELAERRLLVKLRSRALPNCKRQKPGTNHCTKTGAKIAAS